MKVPAFESFLKRQHRIAVVGLAMWACRWRFTCRPVFP
jgi:hypothetical protein